jgi:MOSC domain-containing protein YiiM
VTSDDEESDSGLRGLMARFPRAGRVEWIGLRPRVRAQIEVVEAAEAVAGQGLAGDRYAKAGGARQVTLIQLEHLHAVAAMTGHGRIDPAWLRRNIVVSGINLVALKERELRIGNAVLRWTGLCHPCSRMEQALGPGGYNAMRGHGGITAAVVRGGTIRLGDAVSCG